MITLLEMEQNNVIFSKDNKTGDTMNLETILFSKQILI